MALEWIHEPSPRWDADKARIVGGAPAGVFDRRFRECREGESIPAAWWRVEDRGRTVAYGWLDVVWGEAEILLATDAGARRRGIGSFVLAHLEGEARRRGINYVYNTVRATHPERQAVTEWLRQRGFTASEDGSLFRSLAVGE